MSKTEENMEIEEENKETLNKEKKKNTIVKYFLIIAVIIIILLLFQRFLTSNTGNKTNQVPTGNIDIFEIKCNDNCTCLGSNQPINKLNDDSSLSNIIISNGTLEFNKNVHNYNVLVEYNINKITLSAKKNNDKSSIYYIYNGKVYNNFNNIPISVGENIITIAVIAESGNLTSYRVIVIRLSESGEIVNPVIKDTNNKLSNITISSGNLFFEKNTTNYTVLVDSNIDKITLIATKESEKSTISYMYNGKNYEEFKDVEISLGDNVLNILVTAEDGTSTNYVVTIIKRVSDLAQVDELAWYSTNQLDIFSNPAYEGEAILAPGSSNSYEFIIRNKVNKKVKYQLEFNEKSDYAINMKYRLKRNGKYVIGNEETWVSYNELDLMDIEIDYNRADSYILDWKWFDGDNDSLIGKLQNDYTLSITLSAIIQG